MKRYIKFILLGIGCCVMSSPADRIYGLERMERLDLLPYLLEGTRVKQVSSHDRSGGNDDGFNGTYSYLYIDGNGEYVLFDEIGAGCLYRFWMTYDPNFMPPEYDQLHIRFYFDGESTPRIDESIAEFFDGIGSPLEYPLVGSGYQSSHGSYCYLPFPYRERLRITLTGLPYFYNMTYHCYDDPEDIVSWSGTEDRTAVMGQWNAAGTDPKSTVSNLVVTGNTAIMASSTQTLFEVTGPGVIQSIKLDPSPATSNVLNGVWLQMIWDDGPLAVNVPIGEFFGSGSTELNVSALTIGMQTSGDWYCYFPMPYWSSAEVRVVNNSGVNISDLPFEIQYTTNACDQAKAGYFHTAFHEETFVADETDFSFIEESGRGHIVGLSLFMHGAGTDGWFGMGYLEGDERIHVDGAASPCIYGTGNEDYFNAGWYFNQGLFSLPYHGCVYKLHRNPPNNYTQAYRFHLSDSIPFNNSVKFSIEHGHANSQPGTFSSVVYYYKVSDEKAGMVLTADLDPGNAWSEDLYDYAYPSSAVFVSGAWNYEGDHDDVTVMDEGYSVSNSVISYTVPIIENGMGVLLRRRTDQGVGGQKAHVFVDGVYAGVWYEADCSYTDVQQRWLDSEFMISSNLVSGKTSATISIVPLASSWNEYRYWVYCIRPPGISEDTDEDQLPDDYEMDTVASLAILDGALDTDGDGFLDYDEYIAGTHPTNPASFFSINPDYGFLSTVGRLYQLQECTNLMSNVWTTVRSDIPGTGWTMPIPVAATNAAAYHRLRVDLP